MQLTPTRFERRSQSFRGVPVIDRAIPERSRAGLAGADRGGHMMYEWIAPSVRCDAVDNGGPMAQPMAGSDTDGTGIAEPGRPAWPGRRR